MRIVSTSRPSSRQKPFSWATLKGRSEMEIPVVENLTFFNCAEVGVAATVKRTTTRTVIYPGRIELFLCVLCVFAGDISFLTRAITCQELLPYSREPFSPPQVSAALSRCLRESLASLFPNKGGLRLFRPPSSRRARKGSRFLPLNGQHRLFSSENRECRRRTLACQNRDFLDKRSATRCIAERWAGQRDGPTVCR